MADVSISGHLSLPAGNTIVYNQCAAFKGRHKNDGAALKWEVLPAQVFLTKAGRKEGFSFPPGVRACSQPVLPSCFKHCLSSFLQVIKPIEGRDVEEDFSSEHS